MPPRGYGSRFTRHQAWGWTYVIQSVHGGPVKIGSTVRKPERRLWELQRYSDETLRILHLFRGIDLELTLHKLLADYVLYGEWYEPEALETDEFWEAVAA